MSKTDMTITASKGSIFDDLGYAPEHTVKADLAVAIKARMKDLNLNQTQAAERVGIKQPDLSKILGGHFRGYSVERMTRMLGELDCDVELIIRPHESRNAHIIPMSGLAPV